VFLPGEKYICVSITETNCLISAMHINTVHSLKDTKPFTRTHSLGKVRIVTTLLEGTCLYFLEEIRMLGYVALYFLEI